VSLPTRLARAALRRMVATGASSTSGGRGSEGVTAPPPQTIALDYPVRPAPRYGYGRPPHPGLHQLIDAGRNGYEQVLRSFLGYADGLGRIELDSADLHQPSWHNGWFQGLDAIALYCLLGETRPARYVEIGSGHSTRFARRAISDLGLPTRIRSIDPQPRAEIDGLCDELIRRPLEEVGPDAISDVAAGDIVFFDNSHRCFTNSDVTVAFLELLPDLPPGVLVQFHDIFLPWDYPPQMSDRYYSEQYLLATALLSGARLEVILPNFYVSISPELYHVLDPIWDRFVWSATPTNGLSFWVRTAPAATAG